MISEREKMNILYTCDNNYVWLMGISMISLFENNRRVKELTVYLLGENISESNKKILIQIANKYNRKCIIIDMPNINIPEELLSERWPKSAYSRLFSAMILPREIENIVYLDCDTIISDSIESILDNVDYQKSVYGVKDCISKFYINNIGLTKNDIYINGGVLILNYKRIREIELNKKIIEFMNKYNRVINYADQDVLNGIFKGEIGVLPAKYDVMTLEFVYTYNEIQKLRHPHNYYSEEEIRNSVEKPCIIHFTTNMNNVRPWFLNSNHPKKDDFLKYKNISPWKNMELKMFETNKSLRNKVYKALEKGPKWLYIVFLGIVHSYVFPILIRLKMFLKGK